MAICEKARIDRDDDRREIVAFFVKAILYRFNVQILPKYKALFVPADQGKKQLGI